MRNPSKYFFYLIALPIILFVISSCATNEPYVSDPIEVDQDLYILTDTVTDRNVELLWDLKDSSNERIGKSCKSASVLCVLPFHLVIS